MKPEDELGKYLIENNLTIATAESCTGGLLSSNLQIYQVVLHIPN